MRELNHNVALRVNDTADETIFEVSGRGELHLTILIETMRREGYEFAVSRPRVVLRDIDGVTHEPYEWVIVEFDELYQGAVMELFSQRRAELLALQPGSVGRVQLEYRMPARGMIGVRQSFLTLTRGTGVLNHCFDRYLPWQAGEISARRYGVLVSQDNGTAIAYALWKLQPRGRLWVRPGDPVYEGMLIGTHNRENDLVVNPIREKKLTNVRAAGKDENIDLTPPLQLSLEAAIELINDDELVEITPLAIRLRKRYLKEHERRRMRDH